jgi:ribosomal protein L11 methyltransferase
MSGKFWLEVSLTVDGEMAEAVAEVLRRYLPDGVAIESTGVTAGPADENGRSIGPLRVCGYIPADGNLEETRQKIEQGLWYLSRISAIPAPEFKQIQEVNWMESWKEHYHPISIGQKLLILPAWINEADPTRVPIRIEVGMAFGTGTHPTTQLCLALAEDYLAAIEDASGIRVMDIGCGSGILAISCLKLGAGRALGVDIDPLAIKAAGDNASLNQVRRQLELGIGSVKEVRAGRFSIHDAHLIFANILAPILIQLLEDGLGELLLPQGSLILSGILADQSASVEAAVNQHGFTRVEKRQMGDWVALEARH